MLPFLICPCLMSALALNPLPAHITMWHSRTMLLLNSCPLQTMADGNSARWLRGFSTLFIYRLGSLRCIVLTTLSADSRFCSSRRGLLLNYLFRYWKPVRSIPVSWKPGDSLPAGLGQLEFCGFITVLPFVHTVIYFLISATLAFCNCFFF